MTIQRRVANPPVHPLGALALVLADWLATGLNLLTAMDAYLPVSLGAGLAAATAVFFVERNRSHAGHRNAAFKATCAMALVVVPLPLLGSAVGLALLVWALASWLMQRRAHAAPGALPQA